ncbi:MAG TPA: polysaccharide ABC transporter ATP-binding protein [Gemmatimonadales bacterium]
MTTAIRVQGLGKRYRIGEGLRSHRHLREALAEGATGVIRAAGRALRRTGRGSSGGDAEFWALSDVSFELAEGEAIGVIGGNGAGKSTLLKILSRITAPTTGRVEIRGRVGSLLEVGTGFHPDLTGRENTYLNGAILGMRRTEIERKFDEIVAFAEVERFIDTPVKRYSSGMYLRLAFAVAAHLEPEVLLVDEVLAVGDAAFQQKCLGKMGDVAAEGRTVIFVSHNMAAVQSLCARAAWLRHGRIVESGPARRVVSRYLLDARRSLTERCWTDMRTAPGGDTVRLRRAAVVVADGEDSGGAITTRTPFRLEFEYWNLKPGARMNLSLQAYDAQGTMVFNALPVTEREWQGRPFPVGLYRDVCHVPGDLLNDGGYRIELLVVHDDSEIVLRLDDVLSFEVSDSPDLRGGWYGRWPGVVRPMFPWTTELLVAGTPAGEDPGGEAATAG